MDETIGLGLLIAWLFKNKGNSCNGKTQIKKTSI
jgi:hypothetical protein